MKLFKRNPWITVATAYSTGTTSNLFRGSQETDIKIELRVKKTKKGYKYSCFAYDVFNSDMSKRLDIEYVMYKENYNGVFTNAAKKYNLIKIRSKK